MKSKTVEQFSDKLLFSERVKLLQCMTTAHELFEKHNIWYIISFGTLLGAVRHRNLIPWDDDIDLLVKMEDINKLRIMLKEIQKIGYKTEETWKLFRIYSDDTHFIDIFIIDDENGKIQRCTTKEKTCKYPEKTVGWWHDYFGFNSEQIKHRKRFQFGSLYLWGPVESQKLLKFWYGDDFLTVCKTHYLKNHNETVTPEEKQCEIYGTPQF